MMANNNTNDMLKKKSELISSFINDADNATDNDDDDEIISYFNLDTMNSISRQKNNDQWQEKVDDKAENVVQSLAEEHVLSQKLSQLSTTTTTTQKPSQSNKRKCSDTTTSLTTPIEDDDDQEEEEEEIPAYLSTTHPSFEKMIQQIPTNSIQIEELRQIAIIIHQCAMIKLKKSLWLTYFKAGTGTWNMEQPGPEIWPMALQSIILSSKKNPMNENNMDDLCLKFVHTRLSRLNHQEQQYQDKLHEKTNPIDCYKTTIEPIIQSYIQHNLQSLHAQYEYTMALIGYDYEDHRLELEFLAQEPNHHQIELFKCLCHQKYEQEKAKQEYLLLKEQMTKKKFPHSFDGMQISLLPSLIQTIHDLHIRQYLYDRHQKLMQNYKHEMMTIFIKTAEVYMFQREKLFDHEMATMRQNQKILPINERFNDRMLNLIDQRFTNTIEKLQCIYNYKMFHYFGTTSTMNN